MNCSLPSVYKSVYVLFKSVSKVCAKFSPVFMKAIYIRQLCRNERPLCGSVVSSNDMLLLRLAINSVWEKHQLV